MKRQSGEPHDEPHRDLRHCGDMNLPALLKLDGVYLKNIGFQSSGTILAQIVNIASLPIITRLFDPAEIGIFNLFVQALAIVTILISLRVEQVVMLPKADDDARQLVGFVAGFGAISCALLTAILACLVLAGWIPVTYCEWVLILPLTSFLVVFAQASQQMSQRSFGFRRSGISEVANRASNSLVSLGAGFLGLPGIWLGMATAFGFVCKLLIISGWFFKLPKLRPFQAANVGRNRLRQEKLDKLTGSMVLSHSMLAVTGMVPLGYISFRYGTALTGQFALVIATLSFPTTLVGNAVGQVFYQRASHLSAHGSRFDSLLLANARILLIVAVPAFLFIAVVGPLMYPFLFGVQWDVAGQTAQIYALAAAFSFMTMPFDKSGLIVNAWWYGLGLQFGRLVTTLAVVVVGEIASAPYLTFIWLLAIQSAMLYAFDGCASYLFSRRNNKFLSRS